MCIDVLGCEGRWVGPKMVLKGNLSEMMSNWQISIGYEDNQIMTGLRGRRLDIGDWISELGQDLIVSPF